MQTPGEDMEVELETDLTERDKFDYLKGLLDREAHDSIANYKMDAKNYRGALKLLTERYGDTE